MNAAASKPKSFPPPRERAHTGRRELPHRSRCCTSGRTSAAPASRRTVGTLKTGSNETEVIQRSCSRFVVRFRRKASSTPSLIRCRRGRKIAAWQWLYGRHSLRGEVAGTVAMGGTGKSSSSIVETLAMASARELLGEQIQRPLRVVLINLEDTRNTMDKRIAAAMRQYRLTPADIGDRLIVKAKGEIKIKVARQLRSGDVERDEEIIDALTKLMIEHKADVLSIDSFIRTHRGERERQFRDPGGGRVLREYSHGSAMRRASVAPHPQVRG